MTDLRTAAQQALEAMEREAEYYLQEHSEYNEVLLPAIDALRAALAEPVREPVAWLSTDCIGERDLWFSPPLDGDQVLPLYAAPPQRKPLTEEEILSLFRTSGSPTAFARAIERAHGIT